MTPPAYLLHGYCLRLPPSFFVGVGFLCDACQFRPGKAQGFAFEAS